MKAVTENNLIRPRIWQGSTCLNEIVSVLLLVIFHVLRGLFNLSGFRLWTVGLLVCLDHAKIDASRPNLIKRYMRVTDR